MESEKIVKKFIKLAKDEGLAELKFEDKSFKIELKFPRGESNVLPVLSTPQNYSLAQTTAPAQQSAKVESEAAAPKTISPVSTDNYHQISSPLVGTFYASSSPGKDAFVQVGTRVKKGQTLCIVEAMKIMNEIEADVDGEIVEILVDNESVVEYGQGLFKIKT